MRGTLVAIDLETTGLDPAADAIIEVGAVRMVDGQIVAEYNTLVNPGRPIPEAISHLTGIFTDDVLNQPSFADVIPELREFVGSAPVIAHNISFDLAFLNRHGLLQENRRLDTYDLASVLLPGANRYNLHSLATMAEVDLEHAHRALHDARAAALLYWWLWQRALALPSPLLQEICAAAQLLRWDAAQLFEAALAEQNLDASPQVAKRSPQPTGNIHASTNARSGIADTRRMAPTSETITDIMAGDGPLARRLPYYEHRRQQVEMAQAVLDAFAQSKHVLIEAGTGTGKSLAYLLPSMLWSAAYQERVVISTNTINLQQQLMDQEIPALAAALDLSVTPAVLKGRNNYLCPRRFEAFRRRQPVHLDELRLLLKILIWLYEGGSGDRSEINIRGPIEQLTWNRLSADDEGCTLEHCQIAMHGACPFYQARRAAEAAHLVVVNHALLFTDLAHDQRALPPYRSLILDEAHHLEEAATAALTRRLDESSILHHLADLGGPSQGLLGDVIRHLQGNITPRQQQQIVAFAQNISAAVVAMETHVRSLFKALREFLISSSRSATSDYGLQLRLTPAHRAHTAFAPCQTAWLTLDEFFAVVANALGKLRQGVAKILRHPSSELEGMLDMIVSIERFLADARSHAQNFILSPDLNTVYWISAGPAMNQIALHAAPLHIGAFLEQAAWSSKNTVVLTSATLRTHDSFDYIRSRLNAEHAESLEFGSPFNYRDSTLVLIPTDIPEPNETQGYQQAVETGLITFAQSLNGRMLALFTSYSHLRQTAQAITPRLALGDITVLDQSDGGSRQTLLDGFKKADKAVLLGTRSFWEGIDIPGEALSALAILRLPFAVPTDPIVAARTESYHDGFNEYTLPDAILRFRQGFGRLIRSRTDRGVVVIFDKRITSKSYGASFLEALPDCAIHQGPLRTLPDIARNWLNQPQSS